VKNASFIQGSKLHATFLCLLLTALLWSPQIVIAEQLSSDDVDYENISVRIANRMIKKQVSSDLAIIDVRSRTEYAVTHLHNAIVIPHEELETRIEAFEEYKKHDIIVYCRSGYRSIEASEFLANHGFVHVYNMIGGILAWIDAGYSLYTTSHHATVSIVEEDIKLQIEPALLDPVDCGCRDQNQPRSINSMPTEIASTVIQQDSNQTRMTLSYLLNGETYEVTIVRTLMWNYIEVGEDFNRTAILTYTESMTEDSSFKFYQLRYQVKHTDSVFVASTLLIPVDSRTYGSAFTSIMYIPVEKSKITTLEIVDFNTSALLSQQYLVYGKVANKIGKAYEKSDDEMLVQFGERYQNIEKESKTLSRLIRTQLDEYDKLTQNIHGSIIDGFWECFWCEVACNLAVAAGCVAACVAYPPFCAVCVALLEYMEAVHVGCALACDYFGCEDWIW